MGYKGRFSEEGRTGLYGVTVGDLVKNLENQLHAPALADLPRVHLRWQKHGRVRCL